MTLSSAPTLVDRRDARRIKEIARDLCVSVEDVPVGDGRVFTAVPVRFVLDLMAAPGNLPEDEILVVIERRHLNDIRQSSGIKSIQDELAAVRALAERQVAERSTPERIGPSSAITAAEVRELLVRRSWSEERLCVELINEGVRGASLPMIQRWLAGESLSHHAASALRHLLDTAPPKRDIPTAGSPSDASGVEADREMSPDELRAATDTLGLTFKQLAARLELPLSQVGSWTKRTSTGVPPRYASAIREMVAERSVT